MKPCTLTACILLAALASIGCDPASRYATLSWFFDGVPPPKVPEEASIQQAAAPVEARRVAPAVHGPYAARLCSACHQSAATNTFVVPREQLCFQCHEIKIDKKYVHGPLASGGCTACHDPHSSKYRYLLLAESDSFCLRCHQSRDLERVAAHAGVGETCTSCHDAHMSDTKFLLK